MAFDAFLGSLTSIVTSLFTRRVLSAVRRIPPGRVATYADIAASAGRPGAARAVGTIMRRCGARDVPCHRVVAAGGRLGGFGGTPGLKAALLRAEGLVVTGVRIRDFEGRRWGGRDTGKGRREKAEGRRQKEEGQRAKGKRRRAGQ